MGEAIRWRNPAKKGKKQREKEGEKELKEGEERERERERKEDRQLRPLIYRLFDSRSLLG